MINLNREIRPEDFAHDPERVWFSSPEGEAAREKYFAERAELKRLYEIQEETKARARYKAEQERKDQIPYSEAIAGEICERIAAGEFLINICELPDFPTVRRVNRWLKEHSDFAALHKDAVNDRLNVLEDQLIVIADSSENDFKLVTKGGKKTKVFDAEVVSRAKLRCDVRRATLRSYRPERWSEQTTLNVNNTDNTIAEMTTEELETKLAELEEKGASIREPSIRVA
jgi:hypothetical protein